MGTVTERMGRNAHFGVSLMPTSFSRRRQNSVLGVVSWLAVLLWCVGSAGCQSQLTCVGKYSAQKGATIAVMPFLVQERRFVVTPGVLDSNEASTQSAFVKEAWLERMDWAIALELSLSNALKQHGFTLDQNWTTKIWPASGTEDQIKEWRMTGPSGLSQFTAPEVWRKRFPKTRKQLVGKPYSGERFVGWRAALLASIADSENKPLAGHANLYRVLAGKADIEILRVLELDVLITGEILKFDKDSCTVMVYMVEKSGESRILAYIRTKTSPEQDAEAIVRNCFLLSPPKNPIRP